MKTILREGVNLAYKTEGQGNCHFVFIHNAGGNHQFMEPQFQYFNQFGKVLSMDLRGHGSSDKPAQNYTTQTYADDIAYLCQSQGISQAIFVGLNYGANVAIELAATSSLVSHLALIDPPIFLLKTQAIQDHIHDLENPACKNFAKRLVEEVFLHTKEENKQMAIRAFETTSKAALASTYKNLLEWDKTSSHKLAQCTMPILSIQSSTPFCTEESLQKVCPHLKVSKVLGSGPWATLEVPNQINSMIERFLEIKHE